MGWAGGGCGPGDPHGAEGTFGTVGGRELGMGGRGEGALPTHPGSLDAAGQGCPHPGDAPVLGVPPAAPQPGHRPCDLCCPHGSLRSPVPPAQTQPFSAHPPSVPPPAMAGLILHPPHPTPPEPPAPRSPHLPPSTMMPPPPQRGGGVCRGPPRGCAAAAGARRWGWLRVPSSLPTTKEFCKPRCRHISQAT